MKLQWGRRGNNPSVLGAEPVESHGKSGNEAAAEQQDQEDAGAEKAEAQRVGKASSPGLDALLLRVKHHLLINKTYQSPRLCTVALQRLGESSYQSLF